MPNTSLRRLTTKTLPKIQVNDWRRKFYKSGTAEENSSPDPCDKHRGKSRSRSAENSTREIPLQRSEQHSSSMEIPLQVRRTLFKRRKHLLQFATNSVLLQLYPIHIFTSQIYKYDKGWLYSGGASSQRRIIFAGVNLSQFLWFSNIWISLL